MLTKVKRTLKWASELSEAWVGTQIAGTIESQKKHLEHLVSLGDMNLVKIQLLELTETCEIAQRELDEH